MAKACKKIILKKLKNFFKGAMSLHLHPLYYYQASLKGGVGCEAKVERT